MLEPRKNFTSSTPPEDIDTIMSEGNASASIVITQLREAGAPHHIDVLDDLNIRGEQIGLLYENECSKDIKKLVQALSVSQRYSTIHSVNEHFGTGYPKAVIAGAKTMPQRPTIG